MTSIRRALLGLPILLLGGPLHAEPKGAKVVAVMSGFKSDQGQVLVALFKNEDNFPTKFERAVMKGKSPIKGRKATYVFKDVPPGVWAIATVHDENKNGKMDTNFLGIPKEGWGTSRNARSRIGPPSFDDAKFTVKQGDRSFKITMTY
jgi:uncharacterized protein (DUF2141 family)